eukprot:EG_transcript_11154
MLRPLPPGRPPRPRFGQPPAELKAEKDSRRFLDRVPGNRLGSPSEGTARLPSLPPPSSRAGRQLGQLRSIRSNSSSSGSRHSIDSGGQRSTSTGPSSVASPKASPGRLCCDKCDGPHDTDACPVYKKPRESHADAWVNKGRKKPLEMGDGGGNFRLRNARVVPQPGDGSCLFHSMSYGLGGTTARTLRREIAAFIEKNPSLAIADSPMSDWVQWDSQCSVGTYARRMAVSGWGGGIEMAACSRLKEVNVHVYERCPGGFKRISCFNVPNATKTIHVLYGGGVHFDALVPQP